MHPVPEERRRVRASSVQAKKKKKGKNCCYVEENWTHQWSLNAWLAGYPTLSMQSSGSGQPWRSRVTWFTRVSCGPIMSKIPSDSLLYREKHKKVLIYGDNSKKTEAVHQNFTWYLSFGSWFTRDTLSKKKKAVIFTASLPFIICASERLFKQ